MTRQTRIFATYAVAVLASVSLGRLAAAADQSMSASPAPAATPTLVTIKDFAFSPLTLSIPVGGSVTFKNLDTTAHTATDSKGAFDSGNLAYGQSYTYTFKKAGTYKIVCTYHASMVQTIVVGGPAPVATPTPESGY